jgi:hypothetical protein
VSGTRNDDGIKVSPGHKSERLWLSRDLEFGSHTWIELEPAMSVNRDGVVVSKELIRPVMSNKWLGLEDSKTPEGTDPCFEFWDDGLLFTKLEINEVWVRELNVERSEELLYVVV